MNKEKFIKVLLDLESGFTADEKTKLTAGFDRIYLNSRIHYHRRLARKQSVTLFLLVVYAILALAVIFFLNQTDAYLSGLIKGVMSGYLVALLVIFPKTVKNHSRIAYVLKVIKELEVGEYEADKNYT
ncbi:MAG TPA: hypothetical protein ENN49_07935 [Bacteroidales bacterium]|nr:hypothetical protein [Bacteroidales bacterium]